MNGVLVNSEWVIVNSEYQTQNPRSERPKSIRHKILEVKDPKV